MIRSLLLLPLISSCVAAPSRALEFDAKPETVRSAVQALLEDYAVVQAGNDRLVTGWSPEYGEGQVGWLITPGYRVRVRHDIVLSGSRVEVTSTVERRAPAGPRSRRWERVDGTRASGAFLDSIVRSLEKKS